MPQLADLLLHFADLLACVVHISPFASDTLASDKALYAVKARGRNKVIFGRTVNGDFQPMELEPQTAH